MHYYKAYELVIHSDTKLYGLPEINPCYADVTIETAANLPTTSHKTHFIKNLAGEPEKLWITISAGSFYIEKGRRILYAIDKNQLPIPLSLFLMGSCFGALLQQRGYIVLHANTIQYPDKMAHCFAGDSGAGKSTMAGFHIQQGATSISDDITAIHLDNQQTPWVLPGFQRLKLWQDSIDLLAFTSNELLFEMKGRKKFHISLDQKQFSKAPQRLQEIIVINPSSKKQMSINGTNKITTLLQQTYRHQFLIAMNMRSDYFKKLLCLSKSVQIKYQDRLVLSKNAH